MLNGRCERQRPRVQLIPRGRDSGSCIPEAGLQSPEPFRSKTQIAGQRGIDVLKDGFAVSR